MFVCFVDFVILSNFKKSIVLSLNQSKDTYGEMSMSTSESSLFSVASSFYRQKVLTRGELVERYKNIINRSVEFIFAPSKYIKYVSFL